LALPASSDDWPIAQLTHSKAPALPLILPFLQLWHTARPVTLPNIPGKHAKHAAEPSLPWYWPVPQSEQAVEFDAILICPFSHAWH
jgi:hypothetical protein